MSETFDAYHKWLGIAPKDQPPNHYRLWALICFESDPDVIAAAADQRMTHVRSFQTGKYSGLSQKLLNEIAAAKICLLNLAKARAYDEQLRKEMEPSFPEAMPLEVTPVQASPSLPEAIPSAFDFDPLPTLRKKNVKKNLKQLPLVLAAMFGILLLAGIALMWISQSNGISESKREVASKPIDDPKPRPLKPSPQPIAVTPRPQPLVQPEPVSQPEPKREPVKPELDRNPDSKSTLEAQTKGDVERPTAKPHAPVGKQASPPKGEEGDEQLSPIPAAAEAHGSLHRSIFHHKTDPRFQVMQPRLRQQTSSRWYMAIKWRPPRRPCRS